MNDMSFFTDIIRPVLSMCAALLSIQIWGVELWKHLLGLLIFSFVVGLIIKGNGFNGSFIPAANAGSHPASEISAKNVGAAAHSDSTISYDVAGALSGRGSSSALPSHDYNRVYVDDYEVH